MTSPYPLQSPPRRRLQPYAWSELHLLPKRRALIKGLLDCSAMSIVYGESNCGKTFLALELAAHIARGMNWRGRKTRQGAVVYIAAEGGLGLEERLTAFRRHHAMQEYPPFYLIPAAINLCSEDCDTAELIGEINALVNVAVVVIDTLSRAMAGGNENSPDDMTAFIGKCDRIKEETGAHIMVIHHSGKDSSKGARGHSALRAAADTEIEVTKDSASGIVTAEVKKQRDSRTGDKFFFTLKSIELGQDEDGDKITSCVLIPTDETPSTKKSVPKTLRRPLEILQNCLIDKGTVRPVRQGMPAVMCITLDEYREALKIGNISGSDKPDSVNKAVCRAIDRLNDASITVSYGDYIWLADKQDKTGRTKFDNSSESDRQDTPL